MLLSQLQSSNPASLKDMLRPFGNTLGLNYSLLLVSQKNVESVMSISDQDRATICRLYRTDIESDYIKGLTGILNRSTPPLDIDTPTEATVTWGEARQLTPERLAELRQTYCSPSGAVNTCFVSEDKHGELVLDQFRSNAYVTFRSTRKIPKGDKIFDTEIVTGCFDPNTGFADGYWKREYTPFESQQESSKIVADAIYSNGFPIFGSLQFGNGFAEDEYYRSVHTDALHKRVDTSMDNYFLPSLGREGVIARIKLDPHLSESEKSKLTIAFIIQNLQNSLPALADEDQKARNETVAKDEATFQKFMLSPFNPLGWFCRAMLPGKKALEKWLEETSRERKQENYLKLRKEGRDQLKVNRCLGNIERNVVNGSENLSPYARNILQIISSQKKQEMTPGF